VALLNSRSTNAPHVTNEFFGEPRSLKFIGLPVKAGHNPLLKGINILEESSFRKSAPSNQHSPIWNILLQQRYK
jgi:hypothetical protein